MFNFSNLYTKVFWGLISDSSVLELLGITEYEGLSFPPDNTEDEELFNIFMTKCVSQVFEGISTNELVEDFLPKISISERVSSRGSNKKTEVGIIVIKTYVTKEENRKNKKTYKLIDSIINALDSKKRKERLLDVLDVGLDGLEYIDRDPFGDTDADGWDLYTILFRYEFIV